MARTQHKNILSQGSGHFDAHCHLDRAHTYHSRFFEHEGPLLQFSDASLPVKQVTVGVIHRGFGFTARNLHQRMEKVIRAKIAAGETGLNAIVDCSPDTEGRAFEAALALREKYKKKMTINVGAYPIFGFKERHSERHEFLEACAPRAQFLVGLPERDEKPSDSEYTLGFEGHLIILIEMAIKYRIPLQVHVDQTNTPGENGTERLIEAVRWLITKRLPEDARPKIWAVHTISPSCYPEDRFERVVEGLKENNIGVICCPHAALSMRQMRSTSGPTHNSIARIREFLLAGIDVRLGTDNIQDLFMPLPESPLLVREIDALASALRFYDKGVLGKIARGDQLYATDLDTVARSLQGDYAEFGWLKIGRNGK